MRSERSYQQLLDAGEALDFLITFVTYGTWLPGDPRGSVNRARNVPGTPRDGPDPEKLRRAQARMHHPPMFLSPAARELCARTFVEVAEHCGWKLRACAARTAHGHLVVNACARGESIAQRMKQRATRLLFEQGLVDRNHDVWAVGQSVRWLWNPEALRRGLAYVVEEQGPDRTGTWVAEGEW